MKCKALLLTCFIVVSAHAELPSLKPNNIEAFNNYFPAAIQDDKEAFLSGGQSSVGQNLKTVKASDVIADYKANELKGNKNYKGQEVRIKTVASSIKEGIANKPYIVVNGKNQTESIFIYIDPKDDRFLEISKGDKIDLICKGDGVVMETPVFKNCVFPADYADNKFKILKDNISKNNFSPKTIQETQILIMYKSFEPDIEKDCLIGVKECITSINNIINTGKKDALVRGKALVEAYKDQLK